MRNENRYFGAELTNNAKWKLIVFSSVDEQTKYCNNKAHNCVPITLEEWGKILDRIKES